MQQGQVHTHEPATPPSAPIRPPVHPSCAERWCPLLGSFRSSAFLPRPHPTRAKSIHGTRNSGSVRACTSQARIAVRPELLRSVLG